jgi:hypothetical protein
MRCGQVEVLSAELGDANGVLRLLGRNRGILPDIALLEERFLSDLADGCPCARSCAGLNIRGIQKLALLFALREGGDTLYFVELLRG